MASGSIESMARIAYLECTLCGHRFSAETPPTVCPVDSGVLYVRYDMDGLRRTFRQQHPAELSAASLASIGMWRYAHVLPDAEPVTLGEGWTPLRQSHRYPRLLIKDESTNPSGTFHARGASAAVTMARQYRLKHLAMASSPDAGDAFAAYAAVAGIATHVFMPQNPSPAAYLECSLHGAEVTQSNCNHSDFADTVAGLIASSGQPWLDISRLDPFCIEGQKTIAYEFVEQLGWHYPDVLFFPASSSAIHAVWKAFDEMEQLSWVTGRRPRIYTPATLESGSSAEEIVLASGGRTVAIEQAAKLQSLQDWAKNEGLFLSPDAAAATAAYETLLGARELRPDDRAVLVNPADGFKYTEELARAMRFQRLPTSMPVGGIITPV